jgi:hypothetical protein
LVNGTLGLTPPVLRRLEQCSVAMGKGILICIGGLQINRVPVYKGPWGRVSWQPRQEGSMDTTTLLIILIVVLILFGGGWYGRGRWF